VHRVFLARGAILALIISFTVIPLYTLPDPTQPAPDHEVHLNLPHRGYRPAIICPYPFTQPETDIPLLGIWNSILELLESLGIIPERTELTAAGGEACFVEGMLKTNYPIVTTLYEEDATFQAVTSLLTTGPEIIHIIAEGGLDSQGPHIMLRQDSDPTQMTKPLRPSHLYKANYQNRLEDTNFVFLSACWGLHNISSTNPEKNFGALFTDYMGAGCVIGHKSILYSVVASVFVFYFYQILADSEHNWQRQLIGSAFTEAKQETIDFFNEVKDWITFIT